MKKEKKRKETWQDGKCVDLQLQLQLHCVASNNHGRWLLRAVLTGPGRSSTQIDGEICWREAFCRQGGMQPEPCWEGKPAAAVSFVRVSASASVRAARDAIHWTWSPHETQRLGQETEDG